MKIQIKNRYNNSILFETDAETIGAAILAAVAAKADLSGANLRSANLRSANLSDADLSDADLSGADLRSADLRSANLSGANLSGADLRSADLSGADLSGANLRSANLSGADLRSADLLKILSMRTILPDGDLIAWKKLRDGVICKLRIPAKAKRIGGLVGRKCRAEYAIVLGPSGVSSRNSMKYIKGKRVKPDRFDPNPLVECSHGIHFFITKEEAEAYDL